MFPMVVVTWPAAPVAERPPDREPVRTEAPIVAPAFGATPSRQPTAEPERPRGAALPIRVLIVEDYALLAEGLAAALGRHADMQVVGVAGTVAAATALAMQERPDVVLMDYHLPDGTGAEAAAAIQEVLPQVVIIMVTGDTSVKAMQAAIQAGAHGFLLKSESVMTQVAAVVRSAAAEHRTLAAGDTDVAQESPRDRGAEAAWRGLSTASFRHTRPTLRGAAGDLDLYEMRRLVAEPPSPN
jgi:DNA-binding NarL/FixJ family response regulator